VHGRAKLIGNWRHDGEPIPVAVLSAVVAAVHAVGGRVAVHAQQGAGSAAAVAARVDSLEHGMGLDPALLAQMAAQGHGADPDADRHLRVPRAGRVPARQPVRDWYVGGASVHAQLCAAAAEAGVMILGGTDSRPHGRVADEIRALAVAGVRPHDALAAGSWAARGYLGLPGLVPGAPADAVVYDTDPRADLGQLDHPRAVILRGRLRRRTRARGSPRRGARCRTLKRQLGGEQRPEVIRPRAVTGTPARGGACRQPPAWPARGSRTRRTRP
jgi:imidazolonepropionase-like amidohydrolase